MANVLSPLPKQKFFTNNGAPAAGYKLFTYAAGTTNKLATYPDSDTSGTNANPIILDYRGEANIWLPPNVAYKFVLAPANDTDPPASPIWSVDDIVDSQLVTLYGGVDTGVSNAYVLDFTANFDAYGDGILIYWIPSNTNSGASTINVNGLGPVNILNQGGGALSAGQVVANTFSIIMYQGTGFKLLTPQQQVFFGGTSGGLVNAYTLTVPLFAFRSGSLLYFAPNISNNGLADVTLSVNGNSASIRNIDGTQLVAGQLRANQVAGVVVNDSGIFTLVTSPLVGGSFSATLTGFASFSAFSVSYYISGNIVSLSCTNKSTDKTGTSNATTMKMTGLPDLINPQGIVTGFCGYVIDDSNVLSAQAQVFNNEITFGLDFDGTTAFTNTGTKGLNKNWTLMYPLN